jgi:EAL domain-containing protein (putative c-di-GMP-specific phosphodiesterase class I)
LARWFQPLLGSISPEKFIPIAEETGLIVPLTTAILQRAFAATQEWNITRQEPLKIAVNLSPRLFMSDDIVADVAGLQAESKLHSSLIELEITESLFLGDVEHSLSILHQFKAIGMNLAMDDFGTGYSSLSYLRRFPLDIIKIDRSLVTGIEHGGEAEMIVKAVIALGRSLQKTVVAEGVENQAQFDLLQLAGCHEFQGYLLSRPLSHRDMTQLLANQPPGMMPGGSARQ